MSNFPGLYKKTHLWSKIGPVSLKLQLFDILFDLKAFLKSLIKI